MTTYQSFSRYGDVPRYVQSAAQVNRQNMTPAELRLWGSLRSHRLDGLKFRRQHTIGKFIVDFCCLSAMLIVEVDGDIHFLQKDNDFKRETFLKGCGFTIVRVRNEDVIRCLPAVLDRIRDASHSNPAG